MEGLKIIVAPVDDPKAIRAAPPIRPREVFLGRPLGAIGIYQNTSGSTSIPKTFGVSLERLLVRSKYYYTDPKERRSLRTGSIEFDADRLTRIGSLIAGNSCIFLRDVNLANIIDLCERAQVSALHMGRYKLASLLRVGSHTSRRFPPFTAICTGGSRVPGQFRKELKQLLTENLWVFYSTSETGMISCARPEQHDDFPEGVGFPGANVAIQIVDSNGEQVAPGSIGQIRLRKAALPNGYIGSIERSLNFADGWFYPRDLVSRKEGEPLVFHGRADDVMILNSINIYPSAIEDILERHPDVKEAVAYPIKSRIHGEIPVAAVVLKEGAPETSRTCLRNAEKLWAFAPLGRSMSSTRFRAILGANPYGARFPPRIKHVPSAFALRLSTPQAVKRRLERIGDLATNVKAHEYRGADVCRLPRHLQARSHRSCKIADIAGRDVYEYPLIFVLVGRHDHPPLQLPCCRGA